MGAALPRVRDFDPQSRLAAMAGRALVLTRHVGVRVGDRPALFQGDRFRKVLPWGLEELTQEVSVDESMV